MTKTVWHPRRPHTDPERYRNLSTTEEERERFGLFYDKHGMLREFRGSGDNEWGAVVSRCRDCGRMWTDPREAHCAGCHEHFGGDKGAEKHLWGLSCRSPQHTKDLELVPRKFGLTWVRTDHIDNPERRAA
jgi:hypothetical protein